MNTMEFFGKLIESQNHGDPQGIYSICSAHPRVIAAAMEQAKADNLPFLIESTVNQVNQFGGYTGMKPITFRNSVYSLAERIDFPKNRIILGGDHLGPYPWRNEPAEGALKKAFDLIACCVKAGYTKIHLDASMPLGGDPVDSQGGLGPNLIARREAQMAAVAEKAYKELGSLSGEGTGSPPVYIIGTDVPPPGGIQSAQGAVPVTRTDDFEETIVSCKREFRTCNLADAWTRVIAVVVQPGVEFGDHMVHEYNPATAQDLIAAARQHPGLVLEGHSTDYQRAELLRQMVEHRIAILKVGPALTFAMRECFCALENIEKEVLGSSGKFRLSKLGKILEKAMRENTDHWRAYYSGSPQEIHISLKYSFLDRNRYYWQVPMVKAAVEQLLKNIGQATIPLTLLSQYLPRHYLEIREGRLTANPQDLLEASIRTVLKDYSAAAKVHVSGSG